jgi:hypothetical protein
MRKVLSNDRARRMLSLDVLSDKAVDRLIAIAKGEEVPPLPERPQAEIEPEAAANAAETAPSAETLSVAPPVEPEGEAAADPETSG